MILVLAIQRLLVDVVGHKKNFTNLQKDFNELDKSYKEHCNKAKIAIENKDLEIQTIKQTLEDKQGILQELHDKLLLIITEKGILDGQLQAEVSSKNKFETDYLSKCALFDSVSAQLNEDIKVKQNEISKLNNKIMVLSKENEDKYKG